MDEIRNHSISMKNRDGLTITEVEDVESFDEEKVIVHTSMGILTVMGADFRIHKLNIDEGQLVIDGAVDEIKYSDSAEREQRGGFSPVCSDREDRYGSKIWHGFKLFSLVAAWRKHTRFCIRYAKGNAQNFCQIGFVHKHRGYNVFFVCRSNDIFYSIYKK